MSAEIRVELPLPIDISATLTAIIGKTWPGSVIKDDGNDKEFAREAFNQEPRAKNYIETKLQDKETGKRFVFTLARSQEQTPHALRMKAEAERDALKAKLETTEAERDQYKRELDAVPWEYVPKDIYDRAINDTADT